MLCARETFCDVYIRYQESDFRELIHEDDGNRNLTNLHVEQCSVSRFARAFFLVHVPAIFVQSTGRFSKRT